MDHGLRAPEILKLELLVPDDLFFVPELPMGIAVPVCDGVPVSDVPLDQRALAGIVVRH